MALLQLTINNIEHYCTVFEDKTIRLGYANKSCIDEIVSMSLFGESLVYTSQVTQDGETYTITEVGYCAFKDCTAFLLEFPSSVTKIHPYAFKGSLVEIIDLTKTEVLEIPEYCFQDAFGEIQIPEVVQKIGEGAYAGSWIIDFVGSPGITEMGYGAFMDTIMVCTVDLSKTKIITIPAIFQQSFVLDILLPETLITIEKYAFSELQYPPKKFSGALINIEEYAFFKSVLESKVSFYSTSLMSIGAHAFEGCKLETFLVPKSLSYIGDYCFCNTPLIEFDFSAQLNYLGEYAFNSSRLIKADLTETVLTEIGIGCFDNNIFLSTLKLPKTLQKLNPILQNNDIIETITVVSNVNSLSDYCFKNYLALREINLNETKVKSIPNGCFAGCNSLVYITLPLVLETIEAQAFENATALVRIMSCGSNVITLAPGSIPSSVQLYTSVIYQNSPEGTIVTPKCAETEVSTLRYWGESEKKINVLLIVVIVVSVVALIIIVVVIAVVMKKTPISAIVEEDYSEESKEEKDNETNETKEKELKSKMRRRHRPKIVTTVPSAPHYLTTKPSSKGFEVSQYKRSSLTQ